MQDIILCRDEMKRMIQRKVGGLSCGREFEAVVRHSLQSKREKRKNPCHLEPTSCPGYTDTTYFWKPR